MNEGLKLFNIYPYNEFTFEKFNDEQTTDYSLPANRLGR